MKEKIISKKNIIVAIVLALIFISFYFFIFYDTEPKTSLPEVDKYNEDTDEVIESYDDEGNKTGIVYRKDGTKKVEGIWRNNGKLYYQTFYDKTGFIKLIEMFFREDGSEHKIIWYNEDGELLKEHLYDEQGNIVEKTVY